MNETIPWFVQLEPKAASTSAVSSLLVCFILVGGQRGMEQYSSSLKNGYCPIWFCSSEARGHALFGLNPRNWGRQERLRHQ